MTGRDAALDELIARERIRTCLLRYCRAIDRVDEDLLRSVYWPEAVDNHGSFNGPAAEFIPICIKGLEGMNQTMHMLGNMLIEVAGTSAVCETYFLALHRYPGTGAGPRETHLAGRYLDRMERRGEEWRILHRDVVYDFVFEEANPADWAARAFNLDYASHRGRSDPGHALFSDRPA